MWMNDGINAKYTGASDREIHDAKRHFPVNEAFLSYLQLYGRDKALPVSYANLVDYSYADSLKDKKGKWTYWENAVYEPGKLRSIKQALIETYFILKKMPLSADPALFDISSINFCEYGNSIPFRIKIIHKQDDHADFFYVKQADASRIYGLELEHLLTHNSINYLHDRNTLVEEHISGISGDVFLQHNELLTDAEKTAIAKAFVQFNESCFIRLLGDMRSYNFVVTPTSNTAIAGGLPDAGFRLRAIDFDQQSYEGRKVLYFPRFYEENAAYVELVLQNLSTREIEQSRELEFKSMAAKIVTYRRQLMELVNSMVNDDLSENYKIQRLRTELNEHFSTSRFTSCKTMGAILKQQLKEVLQKHLRTVYTK